MRDALYSHTIDILHSYRKYCSTSTSPGQLILPEALKLLPLYVLGLSKTYAFRIGMFKRGWGGAVTIVLWRVRTNGRWQVAAGWLLERGRGLIDTSRV